MSEQNKAVMRRLYEEVWLLNTETLRTLRFLQRGEKFILPKIHFWVTTVSQG